MAPTLTLPRTLTRTTCSGCANPDPDPDQERTLTLTLILTRCAGCHRAMGTHVSKVRSLTMDSLAPPLLRLMRALQLAQLPPGLPLFHRMPLLLRIEKVQDVDCGHNAQKSLQSSAPRTRLQVSRPGPRLG